MLAIGALAAATFASASSLTLVTGGGSSSSINSPIGSYGNANVAGSFDLSDVLALNASLTGTHDNRVPPAAGVRFGTSAADVWNLGAGLDWNPSEAVSFSLGGTFSPKSRSSYDTSVTVASVADDGRLSARTGSWGGSASASYDIGAKSTFESAFSGDATYTHLSTTQSLDDFISGQGAQNLIKVRSQCRASTSITCKRLAPLLAAQTAELGELALSLSYTATIAHDTSLLVSGTSHSYGGKDPTSIGLFSVASLGRTSLTGRRAPTRSRSPASDRFNFGGSLPISPLSWEVSTGLSEQVHRLGLSVVGGYGRYYGDSGHTESVTGKVSYALSEHWKLLATLGGSRDQDSAGAVTNGKTFSAGVKSTF